MFGKNCIQNLKTVCAGVALLTIGTSLPAQANPSIQTPVMPAETIVGYKAANIHTPPILPAYFTLPIQLEVAKNSSITTNTPITDKSPLPEFTDRTGDGRLSLDDIPGHRAATTQEMNQWASKIRGCMSEQPQLVRVAMGREIPVQISGKTGHIVRNSSNNFVCPI